MVNAATGISKIRTWTEGVVRLAGRQISCRQVNGHLERLAALTTEIVKQFPARLGKHDSAIRQIPRTLAVLRVPLVEVPVGAVDLFAEIEVTLQTLERQAAKLAELACLLSQQVGRDGEIRTALWAGIRLLEPVILGHQEHQAVLTQLRSALDKDEVLGLPDRSDVSLLNGFLVLSLPNIRQAINAFRQALGTLSWALFESPAASAGTSSSERQEEIIEKAAGVFTQKLIDFLEKAGHYEDKKYPPNALIDLLRSEWPLSAELASDPAVGVDSGLDSPQNLLGIAKEYADRLVFNRAPRDFFTECAPVIACAIEEKRELVKRLVKQAWPELPDFCLVAFWGIQTLLITGAITQDSLAQLGESLAAFPPGDF